MNKIVNYFKIISGIILISIGIYSEVSILIELSDYEIRYTDGEIISYHYPNLPQIKPVSIKQTRPINGNFHLLFGFGLVAGAILLNSAKSTVEK
jgi:hypothetical protein